MRMETCDPGWPVVPSALIAIIEYSIEYSLHMSFNDESDKHAIVNAHICGYPRTVIHSCNAASPNVVRADSR
jgi:hypothetical protein